MDVYIYGCNCVYICMYIYIWIYRWMYIYIHTYMDVCIYIYTYDIVKDLTASSTGLAARPGLWALPKQWPQSP